MVTVLPEWNPDKEPDTRSSGLRRNRGTGFFTWAERGRAQPLEAELGLQHKTSYSGNLMDQFVCRFDSVILPFDPKKLPNFFALRLENFPLLHAVTSAEQEEQKMLNVTFACVYNSFKAFSLIPCQHCRRLWPLCFSCSPGIKVPNKTSRLCCSVPQKETDADKTAENMSATLNVPLKDLEINFLH